MKQRILIVEDEVPIAEHLRASLELVNYSAKVVHYGKDAVKEAIDFQPALVLMDIHLKGNQDGIAAAAEIRKNRCVPIIFLTAYTDKNTVERAVDTQPAKYLVKPFREDELLNAIKATIENAAVNHIFVQKRECIFEKINLADVRCVKSERGYRMYHCSNSTKHIEAGTLSDFTKKTYHPDFMRVNNSYIINKHVLYLFLPSYWSL